MKLQVNQHIISHCREQGPRYDPVTGHFTTTTKNSEYRLDRPTYRNRDSYVSIWPHEYRTADLALSLTYGLMPEGFVVRHLNGDPLDNRLCNLECVPDAAVAATSHRTATGLRNVTRMPNGRFRAKVVKGGVNHIREFDDAWEAASYVNSIKGVKLSGPKPSRPDSVVEVTVRRAGKSHTYWKATRQRVWRESTTFATAEEAWAWCRGDIKSRSEIRKANAKPVGRSGGAGQGAKAAFPVLPRHRPLTASLKSAPSNC